MLARAARPSLSIHEKGGRVIKLDVHHRGAPSSLLERFPLAVIRRAADRFDLWRTRREEGIARLARRMDSVSREIVYQHLLLPHCEKIAARMERQAFKDQRVRRRMFKLQPSSRKERSPREVSMTLTEAVAQQLVVSPVQAVLPPDRSRGR